MIQDVGLRSIGALIVICCTLSLVGTNLGYSQSTKGTWEDPPPGAKKQVSLSQPKAEEKVLCDRHADGVYRFSASGTSSGLSKQRHGLLLWVRPVRPPSETPGWYLQRPPVNGISEVGADGSWVGMAQIGNVQWPPHEGDLLDFAVTIADSDTINKLMTAPGVVVRSQPVGEKVSTALRVVVTLK